MARHPCQGRKCTACRHKTPELTCDKCHRDFFGADCYRDHKKSSDKDKKTMCDIFTKCTECCKIIEHPRNKKNKGGKKHQCGVTQCPICQEDVDIRTHKCFIQPAEEEERPRRSKEERNARIKRIQRQGIPMSAMDPDELDFKDPPIFFYADYEAMQSADGEHRPIMVCCETDQENHTHLFYGERFSKDFLEFLDQLAINEDEFERPVIVMFHNLKGYDGMFILQELSSGGKSSLCRHQSPFRHVWPYQLQGLFLFSTLFISFIS